MAEPKVDPPRPLTVLVCEKCGRQVKPSEDHSLGLARRVGCAHGRRGLGVVEQVAWKRIEVVPKDLGLTPKRRAGLLLSFRAIKEDADAPWARGACNFAIGLLR